MQGFISQKSEQSCSFCHVESDRIEFCRVVKDGKNLDLVFFYGRGNKSGINMHTITAIYFTSKESGVHSAMVVVKLTFDISFISTQNPYSDFLDHFSIAHLLGTAKIILSR